MVFNTLEGITALTGKNPFERFPDGRPRVPDDLIERMRLVTSEEAWGVLEPRHGYNWQFTGNWVNLHPDRVLVGRAVTAMYVPHRPDLDEIVQGRGAAEGRIGGQNSWIIDTLQEGDVLVVDLFGKIKYGTFVGDNLSTSIANKAGTGLVVDGGIRDLQRVIQLEGFNVFCRGVDPTPIRHVTLAAVNVPVRIGEATVLPGDVVLGTRSGVTFIPPHLAQEVVERSENTRERDIFGQQRLREGKYTPGEIDVSVWIDTIEADYQEWRKARQGT